MPLQPFQSGREAVRTHICVLVVSVGSHTNTCLAYKLVVLPSVVHSPVPFLAFQDCWGHITWVFWTNRTACGCNDSYDSVMYGRATQTSITMNIFLLPNVPVVSITIPALKICNLTSLLSGDGCTDSPPTGVSGLGWHSILTTHHHHNHTVWMAWGPWSDPQWHWLDHTLSHCLGPLPLVGELVIQVISSSIAHWRVPTELDWSVGHLEHWQVKRGSVGGGRVEYVIPRDLAS